MSSFAPLVGAKRTSISAVDLLPGAARAVGRSESPGRPTTNHRRSHGPNKKWEVVIANAIIATPDDNEFGPILYTAGPNVTGQFTKDKHGRGVECPAGFKDAAVVGRSGSGTGINAPSGGLFVMFFG